MADFSLVQSDADTLLAMEKHRVDDTVYGYPTLTGAVRIPLQSPDKREMFMLDITRSQIKLIKGTYQNRARGSSFWPVSTSVARLIGILTIKRSNARTCTCTGRASATDGRCRCQRSVSPIPVAPGYFC